MSPQSMAASGFQFGIRKQESGSGGANSAPLKVSKDSHRIRKPPLPLPQVQYRPPIIIHTYSPKVIHTEPDDFMSLVQKLTGSSDTRLRLKKTPTSKKDKAAAKAVASENSQSVAVANLERQGSGSSSTANCGSPSVSEDSSFLVSEHKEAATVKQSNSPRSPLDSHFEFDNVSESVFSHFDPSAGNPFSQQVKVEPMFAFNDSNPFSFFADFIQPTSRAVPVAPPMSTLPRSHMGLHDMGAPLGTVMDQMQSTPGYLSPNLMNHGLPDLSPAAWSQSFLDCLSAPAPSYQPHFPRQRYTGPYIPSTPESSTMVALENIHAFLST
ncbi:hypothetical protein M758_5G075100 [Ceratodon purpureus]|nr:hypothetical protein M758_5G075100 [Ceratodon purpureus]